MQERREFGYQEQFADFHQRVKQHQREKGRPLTGHVPWDALEGQGGGEVDFARFKMKLNPLRSHQGGGLTQ